jgi:peptidoglycan/LPS O-acetylase OafA/YrhL
MPVAPQADEVSRAPRYELVQALRALAAMGVAFEHTSHDALATGIAAPLLLTLKSWLPWSAGVDVFFVVSGFVITLSSRAFFGRRDGPARFLARRIARIVPIYWAMTFLFLAAAAVLPSEVNATLAGPWYFIASFLFIPCARPDGLVEPPLGLGWTLNYEMLFYVVFALFLQLPRKLAIPGTIGALGVLVALGQGGALSGVVLNTWANPIVLEFCAGMLLALLVGRIALPTTLRWLIAGLGIALLHLDPPGWPRALAWGIPALLLMAAASLGAPRHSRSRLTALLVLLGDASYALYLVHPFVMRLATLLWRRIGLAGSPLLFVLASLVIAQLVAVALHVWFERPTTTSVRAMLERWLLIRPKVA